MRFFDRFSIKNKLIVIVLLVSTFTLGTGFSVVMVNNIKTFRQDMVDSTNMSAKLIGWSCISALAFDDKKGVQDILTRIELLPFIVNVHVYNETDTLFAAFEKEKGEMDTPYVGKSGFSRFNQAYLHCGQPIVYQGHRYGTIYLRASTAMLTKKIEEHVITMIALMVGLVVVSYLLANGFQKPLLRPILKLAALTKRVSRDTDYSVRVSRKSEDEIGVLYDGFNGMLEQIQHRELAREQAKAELKASETKYRSMMEAMKDPIYICTNDFRIQYMNRAMAERIGGDATGELCHKALHSINEQCPWCKYKESFINGHKEINIVSPKDNRSYSVSSSTYTNEDGSLSKLSVYRDTTEFIALQNRLQQAQKMETIGNLAGGIAHDFNNILSPIVGLSELLMMDLPPDSLEKEKAEEIFKAGKRGGELVGQILAISRQPDNKVIPTRIQGILKDIIKLTRSTIPANIEIKQDIQQNCGMVMADSSQIHQVGMNLITNAYHAVEEKGGKIKIMLRQTSPKGQEAVDKNPRPGGYVVLSVADTGHGIPKELIDKIFDPYFTTKKLGKGTGLGLAMVYGIVKNHGGDIKVYSEVDKGSTFEVYLPLMEKTDIPESLAATGEIPGGNERILLVDDERVIAELEKQILERLGYKVTGHWHSIEALEAFRASPSSFDLVISDMSMPKVPGDEFIRKLKSIRPDLPIIICTGFPDRISQDIMQELAIEALLLKPIVISDLARTVREVLGGDHLPSS